MVFQVLIVPIETAQAFPVPELADTIPSFRVQEGIDYMGGVGNLVAAALQTKGLIDQAKILAEFKDSMMWIAALAWLFSIGMAVGSVAVFGNYRQAAYLLVGPPLFFWMINTPFTTDGTNMVVGERNVNGAKEDQRRLLQWIGAIGGELGQVGNEGGDVANGGGGQQTITGTGEVDVSFFFAVFDSIVTEAIQAVVGVIMNGDNIKDLRTVGQERALAYVMQTIPDLGPLPTLIAKHLHGNCAEQMGDLSAKKSDQTEVQVRIRETTDINNAAQKAENVSWTSNFIRLDPNTIAGVRGIKGVETPYTDENVYDPPPVSCQTIWSWVDAAVHEIAEERMKPESAQGSYGDDGQYPYPEQYAKVRELLQGGDANVDPLDVLAVYIYKNAVTTSTHSALQTNLTGRVSFNAAEHEAVFGSLSNAEAHGGYMKIRYFASAVPYIQGMMLYLLSIAFPFFAMLLVVPGKATTFFAWCGLWVWVKSWDIGFALVVVLREILWNLMKGRINTHKEAIDWDFPSTVLQVAFNNDPFLSQNTMWVIVSAMTMMVPVLTAHLCLGATQMYDMFKFGIDQTAVRFGNVETNRARRHEANKIETKQRQSIHNLKALYAKAHAIGDGKSKANPFGYSTMTGLKSSLNNWFAGAFSGGLEGSSNSRAYLMSAAYDTAGYFVSHGDANYTREEFSGVQRAVDLENKLNGGNAEGASGGAGGQGSSESGAAQADKPVGHYLRGMIDPSNTLPSNETMNQFNPETGQIEQIKFSESNEFKALFADASAADRARAESGEMTWGELFQRENARQNDLGDQLSAVTRRRQYVQAEAYNGASVMKGVLTRRQMAARYAHAPADGAKLKNLKALDGVFDYLSGGSSRLSAPGLSANGNWWATPSVPEAPAGGSKSQRSSASDDDGHADESE